MEVVWQRINQYCDANNTRAPSNRQHRHPFALKSNKKRIPFELWTAKHIKRFVQPHYQQPADHPFNRLNITNIPSHLRQFQRHVKLVTPVVANLMWRIVYRILPVKSRMYVINPNDPDIIKCIYPNCNQVETTKHALFTCSKVRPIWSQIQRMWNPLNIRLNWDTLIHMNYTSRNQTETPPTAAVGQFNTQMINGLCYMLNAITCTEIWTLRNKYLHQEQQWPPTHVIIEIILMKWCSHIRWHFHELEPPQQAEMSQIIIHLLMTPIMKQFHKKYPTCFMLRSLP
ncbi:unnamed protein product [Aphanomyces euteiches]